MVSFPRTQSANPLISPFFMSITETRHHFDHLQRLLALETKAEAAQLARRLQQLSAHAAERAGQTLLDLTLREDVGTLGGRVLITLGKRQVGRPMPWHRLTVGTPVQLSASEERKVWRGIVSALNRITIQVAIEEYPTGGPFRLDIATDDVAQRRMADALHQATASANPTLANLRDVLLGYSQPRTAEPRPITPFNPALNASQQAAVAHALAAEELAIVHGPPGTGKTTAVVELIQQAVAQGQKVLACAPSNLAVDNMLERLVAQGVPAVRIGHPARVTAELREHTLDLLVENHYDVQLARKMHREAHQLFAKAGHWTRSKPEPGEKRNLRDEARALLAEARMLERTAVARILDAADVICATTTGISDEIMGDLTFDLCVMDEAAQGIEPAAWIPLLRARKVVLAGDHCQLPPTVLSQEALRHGLNLSLMERLMDLWGERVARRLTVQYRMHEQIMAFSSHQFYDGSQVADETVRHHLLVDLPAVAAVPLTQTAVTFIDTAGAGYDEEQEEDGDSRFNREEAEFAIQQVQKLLEAGVAAEEIALISPYSAQVRLLRELLNTPAADELAVEVNSVDGFQGREKEVVIVTLVRSNADGQIGFLADTRRMNVALTRARRKLIVIGDSATITAHPFYDQLVAYFEQIEAYHSVWEDA